MRDSSGRFSPGNRKIRLLITKYSGLTVCALQTNLGLCLDGDYTHYASRSF